jgi:ubiquinone/menaquinone biosynthesis C-methylase UbiE
VDAVTCAQAFHWFQPETALSEIHRVLRPGGGLAIVANVRDESDPLQRGFLDVLGRYRSHPNLEDASRGADILAGDRRFAAPELRRFPHAHRLEAEAFVAQAASESSIALLDDSTRERALHDFRALVGGTDEIELHYVTEVVCTSRSGADY